MANKPIKSQPNMISEEIIIEIFFHGNQSQEHCKRGNTRPFTILSYGKRF